MKSVGCVVVTYNRLLLLKRSISSLREQTNKDFDIIVVNNGSTDGTVEWLSGQENLIVINQENLGGAGGFYTGMKYVHEHNYNWVWMMDDDGVTDPHQLEDLLLACIKNNFFFVNALVCNIDNPESLSFGLSINGNTVIDRIVVSKELIINSINPFNGTMVHRSVIDKIGYIKKEMFIWGDETEYTFRARKAGYELNTITNAIHYHPPVKGKMYRVFPFWNKYEVNIKPKGMSYIHYRNTGYIYKTYMPNKYWSPIILYTILLIRKLKFREWIKFIKFYSKGSKGQF